MCTRIEALLASEEETEIRLTPPVEKALRDIACVAIPASSCRFAHGCVCVCCRMDEAYDSNLLAVEVGEWDDR